jgi:hypothetical protein
VEVQQQLYQAAVRGAVFDDPQGFATLFPNDYPDLTDISSTPNRLLQGNLTATVWRLLSNGAWLVFALLQVGALTTPLLHHCRQC